MGNKPGSTAKPEANQSIDLSKSLPTIKVQLNKLENVYPGQSLIYLFLDSDFDLLIANSSWSDFAVGQRAVNSIFSKLRLTAKQFAQTLNEPETRCIHMKGDTNIFSYYSVKDYHLVIHRTVPRLTNLYITKDSTTPPSPSSTSATSNGKRDGSNSFSPRVSSKQLTSRDKSPAPNHHHHSMSVVSQPPSPRTKDTHLGRHATTSPSSPITTSSNASSSTSSNDLSLVNSKSLTEEEDQATQVDKIISVVLELIYGPSG